MQILHQREIIILLKKYIPPAPLIVEVGAFKGHDTLRMVHQFPLSTIYAFEPVPTLHAALVKAVSAYPSIKTYCVAVSDHDGMMPLYVAHKQNGAITQASSLRKPKERLAHSVITFPETIEVPVVTLATWAQREAIDHIDLLWLDTQGHEMTILASIHDTLLPRVRAIYTEVGFTEAYEGQSHADHVTAWLITNGFTPVARDFENQTSWFFGNILFVRNDLL